MRYILVVGVIYGYSGPLSCGSFWNCVRSGNCQIVLDPYKELAIQLQETQGKLVDALHKSIEEDPKTYRPVLAYCHTLSHTAFVVPG